MQLRLEHLSGEFEDAVITAWHKKENEPVRKGEDLFEVATDKATFDVEAPCDGVLQKIMKKEGEAAKSDEVIAEIRDN